MSIRKAMALIMRLFVVIALPWLLLHPELQFLAPMVDLLGILGVDGVLLLLSMPCIIWGLSFMRSWVAPVLTGVWNRQVAPILGLPVSDNVIADVTLGVAHGVLRYGGRPGIVLYFMHVAIACFIATSAESPLA